MPCPTRASGWIEGRAMSGAGTAEFGAELLPEAEAPAQSHRGLRRFLRHRLAVFGAAVILFLVLACTFGPYLVPYTDTGIDIRHRFMPPFAGPHILGSDPLGRDLLARLLMAGRVSLAVGFGAMALSTIAGTA